MKTKQADRPIFQMRAKRILLVSVFLLLVFSGTLSGAVSDGTEALLPSIGSAAGAGISLVVSPTSGVSTATPLIVNGQAAASGSWQGQIVQGNGTAVADLAPAGGITYTATWAPPSRYQVPGPHSVQVHWSDGSASLTATAPFEVSNFPLFLLPLETLDGQFHPILSPKAGRTFYAKVSIVSQTTVAFPAVFLALTVNGTFPAYPASVPLEPGGQAYALMALNLPSGPYEVRAFAWTGPTGSPLAADIRATVQVVP